ncbi:MAG TPA: DUF4249 family protein [Ignavibacteriales bacterium]|nr:DUF4249 family protein [Ignavibacteriales bacterium]HOM65075.1 DUF4249 family protein [Ignavibacteriales bacterium]HPD67904.1 DUF4249 family protein [Ignavibacteriales bacterium]HPP32325.1 DUF4249 family protein [Ignavibacteriales bacterium]HRR17704.1 DUF4249 family protein [Ignavibacteriales bacterium]
MKKIFIIIALVLISTILTSCGEGKIDITDIDYEPKIVVEAMLYPGENVKGIKISRNYNLSLSSVDKDNIYLNDADVTIIDGSIRYNLLYDAATKSYYYTGNNLVIGYNKNYKIEVKATIDGKELFCWAETSTPNDSLVIYKDLSIKNDDTVIYYKSKLPTITFKSISNIQFYAIANDYIGVADSNSFINDNILGIKYEDIKEKIVDYKNRYTWLQNIKDINFPISKSLDWFDFFFYGKYRLTIYAANNDFQQYFVTAQNTQEMDGNFHHPRTNIRGDGLGYFAAAKKYSFEYLLIRRQ